MLKQIKCSLFTEPVITFHNGLNTIVGDDDAANSIGKSTALMIIDFVFGGDDYMRKSDAVHNLEPHEFFFSFVFGKEELFFMRSTSEYKYVYKCNSNFETGERISVEDFTALLKEKYEIPLADAKFRYIIGRYFRIYGRENLNEKKPIQYFDKETAADSIKSLVVLFDKYTLIKNLEIQLESLAEEKALLGGAMKKELIPNITKSLYKQNAKKIEEYNTELTALRNNIEGNLADIEAIVSKEILAIQKKRSEIAIQRNAIESRLKRTMENITNKKINIKSELEEFMNYFPDFNVEQIKKIDGFHSSITKILKDELKETEKELKDKIADLNISIKEYDEQISEKLQVKNAPKIALNRVVELVASINQLTSENGFFTKKEQVEGSISSATKDLAELREKVLDEICGTINIEMNALNQKIYTDNRRPPIIAIHDKRYSFNTFGDTGTGTAYANLITFDLVLLSMTYLPALIHDLPLLKNIEDNAVSNIISLYDSFDKQIFIAIDKINTYGKETAELIMKNKVLKLSKDKLLFNKNWKKAE
jgi:hypothetical protein